MDNTSMEAGGSQNLEVGLDRDFKLLQSKGGFMSATVFELKQEHLTLLKQSCWGWNDCEYGAPGMDCKRPFGNSGVDTDLAEILSKTSPKCPHCGELLDTTVQQKNEAIYKELLNALEVICHTLSFELGVYKKNSKYRWEKENP